MSDAQQTKKLEISWLGAFLTFHALVVSSVWVWRWSFTAHHQNTSLENLHQENRQQCNSRDLTYVFTFYAFRVSNISTPVRFWHTNATLASMQEHCSQFYKLKLAPSPWREMCALIGVHFGWPLECPVGADALWVDVVSVGDLLVHVLLRDPQRAPFPW